jgi:lysozyme
VSGWQGDVDWAAVVGDGYTFAMTKASEGTYYTSSYFASQYNGSYNEGMIRGAYHFAIPDDSDGTTQADYFVDHGGGWSADGQTLPGTLDIEWNPYGSSCYGLSQSEMADWIMDFADEYYARTGRDMMIYTAASWWNSCVDSTDFSFIPLWIANWGVTSPALPNCWSDYTFWQTADDGSVAGTSGNIDIDTFNGSPDEMYHFALNDL